MKLSAPTRGLKCRLKIPRMDVAGLSKGVSLPKTRIRAAGLSRLTLHFNTVAILILVKADQNYDWNLETMAAMITPQHLCFSAVREIVARRED
jgi:hypothetical protein